MQKITLKMSENIDWRFFVENIIKCHLPGYADIVTWLKAKLIFKENYFRSLEIKKLF